MLQIMTNGVTLCGEKLWPKLDISMRGRLPTANVHVALQQLSKDFGNHFAGKRFEGWCGRLQLPS
jgi:hypothetical protein